MVGKDGVENEYLILKFFSQEVMIDDDDTFDGRGRKGEHNWITESIIDHWSLGLDGP